MCASANIIKKRSSRASSEQLSYMLDFFFQNPGLAGGKFLKLHGKFEVQKKWEEMSVLLNAVGGANKSADQWHTVWRDLKSKTSIKVRERKNRQARTGNLAINMEPVTQLECRILDLIGSEYVEGHIDTPENIPEEQSLQLLLEEGESDFLLDKPKAFSLIKDIEEEKYGETEFIPNTPKKSLLRTTPKTTPRKRKRADAEDDCIQIKFLEIAKQQADALKMMGECFSLNAEANKMQADALKLIGEGFKANAEAIKLNAEAINNLANMIKQFHQSILQ